MASINTHTLLGETTNTDLVTQARTRMQGNGPHQQRGAGVWANTNTSAHVLHNSNKQLHVNFTPLPSHP